MWSKIKQWCLDQVLWAEQTMQDKTGKEKREAVVDRLDELIKLPFYLEWVDDLVLGLGWLVDYICEKLNWLTDFNFNSKTASALAENKANVMTALDAPMQTVADAKEKSIDERLSEICKQYGVTFEPESKPEPSNAPEKENESAPDFFERAIEFTFKYEGGANFTVKNGNPVLKVNAKADKGGPTIYGITWATLKSMCANGVVSHNDITKLTRDEAKKIYRVSYWDKYGWGKLPYVVAVCCLDCCVNHGGFAWILQRALKDRGHSVTLDGKFGPETYNALLAASATQFSSAALALAIINRRREYFRNIVAKNPTQKGFLKGWLNRCDALQKEVKANAIT